MYKRQQPKPRQSEEADAARKGREEADLRGSLENDSLSEEERQQIEKDRQAAEKDAELRDKDFQLSYAVDLLKGLRVLSIRD